MKDLTSEQYLAIGREVGRAWANAGYTEDCGALDMGRAAYAASFPHAVAEALEEPLYGEVNEPWWNKTYGAYVRRFLAGRRARLIANPDAAVEAVKEILAEGFNRDTSGFEAAVKIVAAVDAARAKEAK